jgi:ATP-dependent 26S proteasome regulatory subunit
MVERNGEDLQWALQRRLEDVFSKLGEKYGDLTGRVEMRIHPDVSFEEVGGVPQAKTAIQGFATALQHPERYLEWGITPPKGILLYGPPGTGKTTLARALATTAGAIYYHLKLLNLTSKFGANTGEVLQETLRIAIGEKPGVLFLDEADALSLDHLLPPPQAREASVRLVAALCEKLDTVDAATARVLVVASTSRTDVIDPSLVAPGRLDHLVEVPLPDPAGQQEILDLQRAKLERRAGRTLFSQIDYGKVLPLMGGMSGGDISDILRRALEAKVHGSGDDGVKSVVSTDDLLQAVETYRRVRGVVEKIRYGQYL